MRKKIGKKESQVQENKREKKHPNKPILGSQFFS
jgi:hypothetical protein